MGGGCGAAGGTWSSPRWSKKARDNPEGDGKYTKFKTQRPEFADDQLWEQLTRNNVTVTAEPVVQQRSFLVNLLISLAPMLLLVVLWVFIARCAAGRSARHRQDAAGAGGGGGGGGAVLLGVGENETLEEADAYRVAGIARLGKGD